MTQINVTEDPQKVNARKAARLAQGLAHVKKNQHGQGNPNDRITNLEAQNDALLELLDYVMEIVTK